MRLVPAFDHSPPFRLTEQRQTGNRPLRILHDALQKILVMLRQPHDRRAIEQIGVVLEPRPAPAPFRDFQNQVELALILLQSERFHRQTRRLYLLRIVSRHKQFGERHGAGNLEIVEQYLDQRHVTRQPRTRRILHKSEKWKMLVRQRLAQSFVLPPEELGKRRIAGEHCPQHYRIAEQPRQPCEAEFRPARGDKPEQDIVLAGVAVQQNMVRGNENIEQVNALVLRKLPQPARQFLLQLKDYRAAPPAEMCRASMIGREIENVRRILDLLLPVREIILAIDRRRAVPTAIPQTRDRSASIGRSLAEPPYSLLKLGQYREHGVAVEHDVMHREQQNMPRLGIAE